MTTALARLRRLITPPPEPRHTDWAAVEGQLGTALPADYKELIRTYGGSNWDDYLYVLEPGCPNRHYDLIEWEEMQSEELPDLWEFEKKPDELAEDGSRVIPWATTDNGECLYWLVRPGQSPDDWTVMVNEVRGDWWEHYSMTCTEFLFGTLTGEVECEILSSLYPLSVHEFRQLRPV